MKLEQKDLLTIRWILLAKLKKALKNVDPFCDGGRMNLFVC